jgi:hypothetical protein
LVQVGTTARPSGWEERDATWQAEGGKTTVNGKDVVKTGQNPWQVANTEVTLAVKNPRLKSATLLDANFGAVRQVPLKRAGARVEMTLPADAMYVVLH